MATILAIETSCDDTSAAICRDGKILSNVIYSQKIHEEFGGVVPELASRKHEQKIIPIVDKAIQDAHLTLNDLDAIAVTRGPGLVGSLMVGVCFAKSLAFVRKLPLIAVHHMQAHVLANLIEYDTISFPFLCLTVSGGHTQIVYVRSPSSMEVIGTTIDDAAGEAFDKAAKMLGLEYPGGPHIDRLAQHGLSSKYQFARPNIPELNFSFSGLKTSILYFLQKQVNENPNFITENMPDLCASIQHTIVDILIQKMQKALQTYPVQAIALAGGVSANYYLRKRFVELGQSHHTKTCIPSFEYCTDNAGMIAIAAHYQYLAGQFADQGCEPLVKNYAM